MANSKEKLFNEFPPVSTEKWEEIIQKDLKGADYEKKLVWKTPEGFKVKPYYRKEHLTGKEYLNSLPGEFPFSRGNKINSNDWEIRQDIEIADIKSANEYALFILNNGVTSIGFNTGCAKGSCKINSVSELENLLKGIHIDCIGLNFNSGHNSPEIVKILAELVAKQQLDKSRITGSVCFDPLGYLSIHGFWGSDESTDFGLLKSTVLLASEKLPSYRVVAVNGQHFNNAGASVVQELAFSLAMASEYLTQLTNAGISAGTVARHLQINLGVGTNYFMEIAKIRAARLLFAKLLEAYNSDVTSVFINSITSEWNYTIYDPYVNVLRATTESMAATLGGTDALVVKPFDKSFKKSNKFSDRLARNIQIILKEESYFDKIVDPSAGSYYIENLTDSIISEAWKEFLAIDAAGGYLKALKDGIVQKALDKTAEERKQFVATGREILLGTNQYPNLNESVASNIEVADFENCCADKEKVVKPIVRFRGAAEFEKIRLAVENHSKRPVVFMLTTGNPVMRKARATFACNFFACAGYEVVDNPGFKSADEGVKAALSAKADIIVVCSSDEEYAEIVPEVNKLVGKNAITVVAGSPACMDDLKAIGVSEFIHVRSNVLETLKQFNEKLGIKS